MALELVEPVTPTEAESRQAQESARLLVPHLQSQQGLRLQIVEDDKAGDTLTIPAAALRLLTEVPNEMAEGNALKLVPYRAEMTTHEAADYLNVSRPYLIGLLEKGEIPYRKVGTHQRILFRDLLEYKRQSDAACEAALHELAAEAQELGLGY